MIVNPLNEIVHWANDLPFWERAILDALLAGTQLDADSYSELLQYLLEDAGLAESVNIRPPLNSLASLGERNEDISSTVVLQKINNLKHVNALVEGQELTFCPTLTAIYGANASGKSGYARVLGCVGFSRGDKYILQDIAQPSDDIDCSADIEIYDGASHRIINYCAGNTYPELASLYVFDSSSVNVHLTGSNEYSFSPSSSSYLTKMAVESDKVRSLLKNKISEHEHPHNLNIYFSGESQITEVISKIGPKADIEALRQLAKLSGEDKAEMKRLIREIAQLTIRDIPAQMKTISQTIKDMQSLRSNIEALENAIGDNILGKIITMVELHEQGELATKQTSLEQFTSQHFTQIGSETWRRFVESAKELAEAEQGSDKTYPAEIDYCLFCQQQLSPDARKLIINLWTFLESEAKLKFEEITTGLEEQRKELSDLNLSFISEQSAPYRYLQGEDAILLEQLIKFIKSCNSRRKDLIGIIDNRTIRTATDMPNSLISNVDQVIKRLEKEQPEKSKEELEIKLRLLQHRGILGQHLKEAEEYILQRKWAEKAKTYVGSTQHITVKYKGLFNKLVENQYIELFKKTLDRLQRPLKVGIKNRGIKGSNYKQIVLEASPKVSGDEIPPDKVLSEGEKRAVALADFLTEVALDTKSGSIVLDDPVTSLDLEWRETIAEILVAEAKHHQVIIFTHDLPFLYFLKKYSELIDLGISTHWIKRGDIDDKPGYVYCDNCPMLEKDYRTAKQARELAQRAKGASPSEQERLLADGFGALRTAYEAFIIFDLFKGVVMRFEERISFLRLKEIRWDQNIANEVVAKCEHLSRFIQGHLHSDAYAAIKPTPAMLLDEIGQFEGLRKRLADLKKLS